MDRKTGKAKSKQKVLDITPYKKRIRSTKRFYTKRSEEFVENANRFGEVFKLPPPDENTTDEEFFRIALIAASADIYKQLAIMNELLKNIHVQLINTQGRLRVDEFVMDPMLQKAMNAASIEQIAAMRESLSGLSNLSSELKSEVDTVKKSNKKRLDDLYNEMGSKRTLTKDEEEILGIIMEKFREGLERDGRGK